MPRAKLRFLSLLLAGFFFLALVSLLPGLAAQAAPPVQDPEEQCLTCHSNPDMQVTLPSGEVLPLYVDSTGMHASVHYAAGVECVNCHTAFREEHPKLTAQNRRELSLSYYQACQKCHSVNYEKTLDSMHAQAAQAGNLDAPVCTDCHGAHEVQRPDEPRQLISTTCGKCHTDIYAAYQKSIHGSALMQEDNQDVPVCTDCHGVHNVQDPRTAQFRVQSPDLCAGCHADNELMQKYGLSTDVYNLYNLSWHGVDVSVYKANWPTVWHESAVCTDCHGVHEIYTTDNPDSLVNPDHLLETCQKCHPGVGPNWVDAWTGHNRIDIIRTPILYYTEVFYDRFTWAVVWVSILYVLLQILHAVIDRVRRSLP